jgi:hypothetical protein
VLTKFWSRHQFAWGMWTITILTTSQSPDNDASNNGDLLSCSHILISAPELSNHLTTSHSPSHDAINNGECHCLSHKLKSAPDISKHLTTSHFPFSDAIINGEVNVYLVLVQISIYVTS